MATPNVRRFVRPRRSGGEPLGAGEVKDGVMCLGVRPPTNPVRFTNQRVVTVAVPSGLMVRSRVCAWSGML
jgi:hypothetical protein